MNIKNSTSFKQYCSICLDYKYDDTSKIIKNNITYHDICYK